MESNKNKRYHLIMKNALIVVDYQNDFVNGALGFDGAEKLETYITAKIEDAIEKGDDLIFTYDTHFSDYLETEEGKNLPIAHCIKGSDGWKLYGKIEDYKEKAVKLFEKNTFGSLELANFLHKQNYDNINLVGLVSNICVISNAVMAKAALPNAHITVDSKGTASNDKVLHDKSMDVLKGLHVEVV